MTTTRRINSTHQESTEGEAAMALLTREQIAPLIESLRAAQTHLETLLSLAEQKLAALRTADTGALNRLTQDEARTLEAVARSDAARRAVVAELAQLLPEEFGRIEQLSDFSKAIDAAETRGFLEKTAGVRLAAAQLAEKNRVVADVAQRLHSHLRGALADVAAADRTTVGYGREGGPASSPASGWVDAVG